MILKCLYYHKVCTSLLFLWFFLHNKLSDWRESSIDKVVGTQPWNLEFESPAPRWQPTISVLGRQRQEILGVSWVARLAPDSVGDSALVNKMETSGEKHPTSTSGLGFCALMLSIYHLDNERWLGYLLTVMEHMFTGLISKKFSFLILQRLFWPGYLSWSKKVLNSAI